MYILKKKLKPSSTAHYLGKNFPRECKNLHGHNYNYEIEIGFSELGQYDMGLDFSIIKKVCDDYIQEKFDHKTLFSNFQTEAIEFWQKMGWKYTIFGDTNTTAETMACHLAKIFYNKISQYLPLNYIIVKVCETEGSSATYFCNKTEVIDELQSK